MSADPIRGPPPIRRAVSRLRPVVVLVLVLVATGCRIDLGASLAVEQDGSGTAGLEVVLDPEAVARLDELALDPFAELTAAAVDTPDWEIERSSTDEGGLRVRLSTQASDPEALTAALRGLSSGLAPEDPALDLDLDLEVADDGAAGLRGEIGLRPPATAGARRDGQPVGPAGDELAALVAEAVTARLVVSLPGIATDHDADAVEGTRFGTGGSTLTWDVPVAGTRSIAATAVAPLPVAPWLVAAAVGLLLLVVLVAWWWRRRRRSR